MNETLKVKIEADISELKKGVSDAERELGNIEKSIRSTSKELKDATIIARGYGKAQDQLAKELKEGTITQKQYASGLQRLQRDEKESQVVVSNLRRELSGLKANYRDLGGSTQNLTSDVGALGKTTKVNAVPALTSFSQVIQDAPYGIQGVANNIQQLTMQMGYLSTNAGGAKGAMSALIGSLAGPAGILMAVSLVTTLLVKYGDKLGELVGSTNKLASATKEFVGEAMAEASELKVLVDIANNHNASIVARRKAIEEINSKYGEYLGNIDLESIKTDKVKDAINAVTKALIQQAQVKGLQDMISEETATAAEKLTKLQFQQIDYYKQVQTELKKMDQMGYWGNVIHDSEDVIGSLQRIKATGEKVPAGLATAVSGWREATKAMKGLGDETANSIEPFQKLQQALNEQIFSITAVPEFDADEIVINGKKDKEVRIKVKPVLEFDHNIDSEIDRAAIKFNKVLQSQISQLKELRSYFGEGTPEYKRYTDDIQALEDRFTENITFLSRYADSVGENLLVLGEQLDQQNEEYLAREKLRSQQSIEALQQRAEVVQGIFAALSNSISQTLDGGEDAMADFVRNFLKSIGKMIIGLAAQSIASAIAGASSASAAAGPAAPFVLPGLIAGMTGTVKSALNGVPQFATGGIVGGSSYHGDKILARLNSGELILNDTQQRRLNALMNAPAGMSGGESGEIEIIGSTRIEGDALVVAYERAQNKRGRIG